MLIHSSSKYCGELTLQPGHTIPQQEHIPQVAQSTCDYDSLLDACGRSHGGRDGGENNDGSSERKTIVMCLINLSYFKRSFLSQRVKENVSFFCFV